MRTMVQEDLPRLSPYLWPSFVKIPAPWSIWEWGFAWGVNGVKAPCDVFLIHWQVEDVGVDGETLNNIERWRIHEDSILSSS